MDHLVELLDPVGNVLSMPFLRDVVLQSGTVWLKDLGGSTVGVRSLVVLQLAPWGGREVRGWESPWLGEVGPGKAADHGLEASLWHAQFRFASVKLANGTAFCWGWGMLSKGCQQYVHEGLREGLSFCGLGGWNIASCAV